MQETTTACAPLEYRGRKYRAAKVIVNGTPRYEAADVILGKIRPNFARIGLTRLANLTGLDRIGIPVATAVRPMGYPLSVAAGKGLTVDQALVSAAMECCERCCAERVRMPVLHESYAELEQDYPVIPYENLLLSANSLFHRDLRERWVLGWDIVTQCEVPVPWELVSTTAREDPVSLRSFQATSNGLSAGMDFVETVAQGIVEVIERDGIGCHFAAAMRRDRTLPSTRVRLDSVKFPLAKELLDRIRAADVLPVLFDCTTDIEVPTYVCYMVDLKWKNFGLYRGYGAGLDPEVAMVRAITEGVQARAVHGASGVRDDMLGAEAFRTRFSATLSDPGLFDRIPETVDGARWTNRSTPSFEGDIAVYTDRLAAAGIRQIVVFDLLIPELQDIVVLRIVIPGLEGYPFFSYYSPGPRARAFIERSQP